MCNGRRNGVEKWQENCAGLQIRLWKQTRRLCQGTCQTRSLSSMKWRYNSHHVNLSHTKTHRKDLHLLKLLKIFCALRKLFYSTFGSADCSWKILSWASKWETRPLTQLRLAELEVELLEISNNSEKLNRSHRELTELNLVLQRVSFLRVTDLFEDTRWLRIVYLVHPID